MPKQTAHSTTSCSVEGVPYDYLLKGWPLARDMLLPAIDRSRGALSEKSVLKGLATRKMQLWLILEEHPIAAAVTQIVTCDTGLKIARILLAGGTQYEKWTRLITETTAEWGRAHGCEVLQAPGRKGWKPILEKEGFSCREVLMERTL